MDYKIWWQLHLRHARGEALSEVDQQLYDEELERQDAEAAPLNLNLEALKQLRIRASDLANANKSLLGRSDDFDREIRLLEQSLSQETREALGIKE